MLSPKPTIMKNCVILILISLSLSINAQLRINELMSNNVSALMDESYNFSMWVELYNPTSTNISLNTYYLTDNLSDPTKWRLPGKKIAGYGFDLLWMERPERLQHASFKLDPDGGSLYLLNNTGELIDSVIYPSQHRNVSYGRVTDTSDEWTFFEIHSGGFSNNTSEAIESQIARAPVITTPGGLYSSPLVTGFENPMEGDTIYYNLNSNEPNRKHSIHYIPGSEIRIEKNTVLRAKTYSKGKLSSSISTVTYLIGQRDFNLPVSSIVTPPEYLFDDSIGIYVEGVNGTTGCGATTPQNFVQKWDRPANFELFDKFRVSRLNQELDIAISGCGSSQLDQKSLQIKPKKKYGNSRLDYAIFSSRPTKKYKDIVLRNSGHDAFYSSMRDAMTQTLIMDRMDLEYQAYEPAVLFINGEYYGIQNLRERSNEDLIYTCYGIDDEEIILLDIYDIKRNHPMFAELGTYLDNNDITDDSNYLQFKSMIDVRNFIFNYITNIYVTNYDWPHNNQKMWKRKVDGKWRWILFDTDFGFGLYVSDVYKSNSLIRALGEDPKAPMDKQSILVLKNLIKNESFRNEFVDQFCYHISTTFKSDRVHPIIDSLAAKIRTEIPFHKERWSSNRNFESDITRMKIFATERPAYMLKYITERFCDSASVETILINSTNPYTTYKFNSVDIMESSLQLNNFKGRPFTLTANETKGYSFKYWEIYNYVTFGEWKLITTVENPTLSSIVGTNYFYKAIYEEKTETDPLDKAQIFINEIVASNSKIKDEYGDKDDYIELYNAGESEVNLSNWFVSDSRANPVLWQLPTSTEAIVPPKSYLILWADEEISQGPLHLDFKLSASGEYISLYATDKYGNYKLIDAKEFPPLSSNQAYSRAPDGSDNWVYQKPTPLAPNSITSTEIIKNESIRVFPTIFNDYIKIENADNMQIQLYSLTGELLLSETGATSTMVLHLSYLKNGIYLLQVGESSFKLVK